MYLDDLPIDMLYEIIDKICDNRELINIILVSKETNCRLKGKVAYEKDKFLHYCQCIENGKRYKRIIEIYEKFKLLESYEIFERLLYFNDWRLEIDEWYSLIQENDVLFEDRFWMDDNNDHIYKGVEVLKKGISYKYPLKINIDKHELILSCRPRIYIGIKTPAAILIPPRTDIIIEE